MKEDDDLAILLVGSYPLPYGGNSVHVQRLQRALAPEFLVRVIDAYGEPQPGDDATVVRCGRGLRGRLRVLLALRRSRAGIVHFHVSGMDRFLVASIPLLGAIRRRKRLILTIHSGSFVRSFAAGPAWRRTWLRMLAERFDRILTVNDEQRSLLESVGVARERIAVIPAFLPPLATPSTRVRRIVDSLESNARIIVTSGCGVPHYGFALVLDAVERLATDGGCTLVVCSYDAYDETYMAGLMKRAGSHVAFARDLDPGEFAWLLQRSDTYVRATDRDGDAVAIREAMSFGTTVVASDCVARPPGSILFRTGDLGSLVRALHASSAAPEGPPTNDGAANLRAIRNIYAEAGRNRRHALDTKPA